MTLKYFSSNITYILIFLSLGFVTGALHSYVWLHFFSSFPQTCLWILPVVYLATYEEQSLGVIGTIAYSIGLSPATIMSTGNLLTTLLIVLLVTTVTKKFIFLKGKPFFMLNSNVSVIIFPFIAILTSLVFDAIPILNINFQSMIISFLLAPIASIIFFHIISFANQFIQHQR